MKLLLSYNHCKLFYLPFPKKIPSNLFDLIVNDCTLPLLWLKRYTIEHGGMAAAVLTYMRAKKVFLFCSSLPLLILSFEVKSSLIDSL